MLPVYAHLLRGEGYGIIGMVDVTMSILMILVGYGTTIAMTRIYFQRDTVEKKNIYVSTNIQVMFFVSFIVCIPVFLFHEQIAEIAFGKSGFGIYITLAVLTFFLDITGANAANYIVIREQSLLFSFLSLTRLVIGFSLNIYLIVYLRLGVLGYFYSGLATAIFSTLIAHGYAFKKVGLHFNLEDAKEIFKFSLPLMPGYLAMFVRTNAARIILRSNLGLTQLGAYEMLFKFATLIGIFITEPFGKTWGVKRLQICEEAGGAATIARVFTLQMALMLFVGLILSLEIPLILKILTPEEFWLSGNIAFLAVISRICAAAYMHFQFPIEYAKATFQISMVQIFSAIVSVPTYWIFIRYFHFGGAIAASSVIALIQIGMAYKIGRRHYTIPFEWLNIVKLIVITTILFEGINQIDLSSGQMKMWFDATLSQPVLIFLKMVHLDTVKNGKLLLYVGNNIPIISEGIVKCIVSFAFIMFLPLIGTNLTSLKKIIIKNIFRRFRSKPAKLTVI